MLTLLGGFFFINSKIRWKMTYLYESADAIDLAGRQAGEALRALRAVAHVCGQQQVGRAGHAHPHVQSARPAIAAWHCCPQVHAHLTRKKL